MESNEHIFKISTMHRIHCSRCGPGLRMMDFILIQWHVNLFWSAGQHQHSLNKRRTLERRKYFHFINEHFGEHCCTSSDNFKRHLLYSKLNNQTTNCNYVSMFCLLSMIQFIMQLPIGAVGHSSRNLSTNFCHSCQCMLAQTSIPIFCPGLWSNKVITCFL